MDCSYIYIAYTYYFLFILLHIIYSVHYIFFVHIYFLYIRYTLLMNKSLYYILICSTVIIYYRLIFKQWYTIL